jgi:hypothetical protein
MDRALPESLPLKHCRKEQILMARTETRFAEDRVTDAGIPLAFEENATDLNPKGRRSGEFETKRQ